MSMGCGERTRQRSEFMVYGLTFAACFSFVIIFGGESVHQSLYRKYRPSVFADVCGQDAITSVLRGQVASGKFSHAYLFCGTRGTGKTTCAKILAKAMNCLSPVNGDPCGKCEACRAIETGLTLDITEIDAASNNGVDNIRDIIEQITYPPSELKYRVYIVDEVHMLTLQAFNALLKTLEEPPAHAVFILATTELHKLPATIISRCQRYDFSRINSSVIAGRLRFIADAEGITADDDALYLMARLSLGGMRDAIGYLELCAGMGKPLTEKNTSLLLGVSDYDALLSMIEAIAGGNTEDIFPVFDGMCKAVSDVSVYWFELISAYRDLLVVKSSDSDKYVDVTPGHYRRLKACAAKLSRELIISHILIMNDAAYLMQKNPGQKRIIAEVTLIKLCDSRLSTDVSSLTARIGALEDRLAVLSAKGIPVVSSAPAEPERTEIKPEEEPKAEAAEEDPKREEPEKPSEQVKPVKAEKKELRALKCWKEISAKIFTQEPFSASFLSDCKAYECSQDGLLHIVLSNPFFIDMVNGMKDTVDDSVIAVMGSKYTPAKIIIEPSARTEEYSIFDELEEDSGNS